MVNWLAFSGATGSGRRCRAAKVLLRMFFESCKSPCPGSLICFCMNLVSLQGKEKQAVDRGQQEALEYFLWSVSGFMSLHVGAEQEVYRRWCGFSNWLNCPLKWNEFRGRFEFKVVSFCEGFVVCWCWKWASAKLMSTCFSLGVLLHGGRCWSALVRTPPPHLLFCSRCVRAAGVAPLMFITSHQSWQMHVLD